MDWVQPSSFNLFSLFYCFGFLVGFLFLIRRRISKSSFIACWEAAFWCCELYVESDHQRKKKH